MSIIRNKTIEGLKAGDCFSTKRMFTASEVAQFAEMSKDYNPIHFDDRFVDTKGLSGRICHGLLVGSLITEIGGQIGWLASGINFKFKKPVFINDTVTCTLTIVHMDENGKAVAAAEFVNQEGICVMTAELFGFIPMGKDREVLKTMVAEGDPTNRLR
ncbi:MAG: MaoC family dehydratase [Desulfobacterales bacterium]